MGLNVKMCEIMNKVDMMKQPDEIIEILKSKKTVRDWAYIKHDKDEGVDEHYHWAIRFKSGVNTDNVAKWFEVEPQYVGKVKGKWIDIVKYLTHANAPDKYQYPIEEVVASFDYEQAISVRTVDEYIAMIESGEIREYNQFEMIPIGIWARNKTVILNALQFYKERIAMDKNRKIDVIFIQGASGSGKTTYAKKWCEDPEQNYSYCVSSSSNDVLQDYKGEDVLILDDLRDDAFEFADLLKVLDNHTKSSIKSRYNNKHFLGHTIIITSCVELKDWYEYDNKEERVQLHRRVSVMLKLNKWTEEIHVYTWSDEISGFKYHHAMINKYKIERKNEDMRLLNKFGLVKNVDPDFENPAGEITAIRVGPSLNMDRTIDEGRVKFVEDELPF